MAACGESVDDCMMTKAVGDGLGGRRRSGQLNNQSSTEGGSRCSLLTLPEAAAVVVNVIDVVVVVVIHILDGHQPRGGGWTTRLPGGSGGGRQGNNRDQRSHRRRRRRCHEGRGEVPAAGWGGARQVLLRCCFVVVSAVHGCPAVEGRIPQIGVLSTIPGWRARSFPLGNLEELLHFFENLLAFLGSNVEIHTEFLFTTDF